MKVLIIPPTLILSGRDALPPISPPLGSMSIATIAQGSGYDASICDLNVARYRQQLREGQLQPHTAADYILSFNPDLVGFGTICSTLPNAVLISKALKKINGNLLIVFGGPQSTIVCDKLLQRVPEIDFVLRGESDYTFTQFLNAVSSSQELQIPGIAKRQNGRIKTEPLKKPLDVNNLPNINYDTWPLKEVLAKEWFRKSVPIDAGRGCPFNCSFCSTSRFFSQRFRIKNPDRIMTEILSVNKKYGCNAFNLCHDSLTAHREHAFRIADTLKTIKIPEFKWVCSARADTIDEKLLTALKESNCSKIYFGIETGSARMQREINKNLNITKVEPTLRNTLRMGFGFTVSCIIGFPEESLQDLESTLRLLLRWSGIADVNTQLHILAPQAGTPLLKKYENRLLYDARFADPAYFNNRCPEEELLFIENNPDLCSQCHFIPNDKIDREELVELREFMMLLMSALPGIGPFILETEPSIIDLIKRWRTRCYSRGYHAPDETGFFGYQGEGSSAYMKILIKELSLNKKLSEHQSSLLQFWETVLDLQKNSKPENSLDSDRKNISLDVLHNDPNSKPIFASQCNVIETIYDVNDCLQRWNNKGIWKWPVERPANYVLAKQNDKINVNEVSSPIAEVCRLIQNHHSLSQIYSFIEQSDDFKEIRNQYGNQRTFGEVFRIITNIVEIVPMR